MTTAMPEQLKFSWVVLAMCMFKWTNRNWKITPEHYSVKHRTKKRKINKKAGLCESTSAFPSHVQHGIPQLKTTSRHLQTHEAYPPWQNLSLDYLVVIYPTAMIYTLHHHVTFSTCLKGDIETTVGDANSCRRISGPDHIVTTQWHQNIWAHHPVEERTRTARWYSMRIVF